MDANTDDCLPFVLSSAISFSYDCNEPSVCIALAMLFLAFTSLTCSISFCDSRICILWRSWLASARAYDFREDGHLVEDKYAYPYRTTNNPRKSKTTSESAPREPLSTQETMTTAIETLLGDISPRMPSTPTSVQHCRATLQRKMPKWLILNQYIVKLFSTCAYKMQLNKWLVSNL